MFDDVMLAFFDYDRTLYAHRYPMPGEQERSYLEECINHLVKSTQMDLHKWDKPLPCMKWLVNLMMQNKVPCYVLTHEIFNLRDEMKKSTAERDYGISNYLTVDTPDHKVDMIKAVAKSHNVSLDKCMLVDDRMHTVYQACREGIFGIHLSNVVAIYENIQE